MRRTPDRSTKHARNLNAIITKPPTTDVYWLEVEQNAWRRGGERTSLSLNSAPLHVGPLIQKHLWNTKKSVVLTSATLRTGTNFQLRAQPPGRGRDGRTSGRFAVRLQSVDAGVSGDGHSRTGADPVFNKCSIKGLISLTTAMQGRTMVLFTSYASLKATSKGITPALNQADILVYEQGDGSSRRQLMENFKGAERAVLLGTRSFWEGVDVPGEALSCLALARLPFAVPTDPIFAARSETFEQPFMEYSVPDAILKFRQGFGRLIRTKTDRGIVAVFDKRLLTKQYGQTFLQSLPDCTIRRGPTRIWPRPRPRG